jgi:threonine synthase
VTIVGATSGDTGSAAIEACANRDRIDIVILHPHERTSLVQRRQMTTVLAPNVGNVAIEGTFDDCQDLVKALFADTPFRTEMNLSAVNSINWARIAAQIPYYVAAALALGAPDREVAFSVPTGNFGNILAAWAARRMGLPVARLIVGSNRNDILTRFLERNDMSMAPVEPSLSPSMDIQVSSNFERLLFDLHDRDGAALAATMAGFESSRTLAIPAAMRAKAAELFSSARIDPDAMALTMRWASQEAGQVIDPHSAIGLAAARIADLPAEIPIVTLATAHPAKFREAVERVTGVRPPLPPRIAGLFDREERFDQLPADLATIESFIAERAVPAG